LLKVPRNKAKRMAGDVVEPGEKNQGAGGERRVSRQKKTLKRNRKKKCRGRENRRKKCEGKTQLGKAPKTPADEKNTHTLRRPHIITMLGRNWNHKREK